jgi:hypothetical protein
MEWREMKLEVVRRRVGVLLRRAMDNPGQISHSELEWTGLGGMGPGRGRSQGHSASQSWDK